MKSPPATNIASATGKGKVMTPGKGDAMAPGKGDAKASGICSASAAAQHLVDRQLNGLTAFDAFEAQLKGLCLKEYPCGIGSWVTTVE